MKKLVLLLAFTVACGSPPNHLAQPATQPLPTPASAADKLGTGLLVLSEKDLGFFADSIPLFQDSLTRHLLFYLTLARTTCPTCMLCAEPAESYHGPVHPFSCGAGEIRFLYHQATRRATEVVLDTLGRRAYLRPGTGTRYPWNRYMQERARRGDYFQFVRQWDKTVLYNQPYNLHHLPRSDSAGLVGLTIPSLDDVKFYPELVQGYWLKLRYTLDNGTMGTCWVVWRDADRWLIGFKFRSLD